MERNLKVMIDKIMKVPDKNVLSNEEQKLVDMVSGASGPSGFSIGKKELAMLDRINKRSKLTDKDITKLGEIKDKIKSLKPVKSGKKFVV